MYISPQSIWNLTPSSSMIRTRLLLILRTFSGGSRTPKTCTQYVHLPLDRVVRLDNRSVAAGHARCLGVSLSKGHLLSPFIFDPALCLALLVLVLVSYAMLFICYSSNDETRFLIQYTTLGIVFDGQVYIVGRVVFVCSRIIFSVYSFVRGMDYCRAVLGYSSQHHDDLQGLGQMKPEYHFREHWTVHLRHRER